MDPGLRRVSRNHWKDSREEDRVSTFEVIVSIGVTVIALCNLITTLRR